MGFLSSWLRADVYTEKSTGIQFPEEVASYKRAAVTPYEAAPGEGGVAVAYHSDDAEATVYIRTLAAQGRKSSREFLDEAIAGVREMEKRGLYENVKFYEFDPAKGVPDWESCAFTSRSSGRFIISFIHCRVTPTHFIKIRTTTGNPKNEALQTFTKSIQETIDRRADDSP